MKTPHQMRMAAPIASVLSLVLPGCIWSGDAEGSGSCGGVDTYSTPSVSGSPAQSPSNGCVDWYSVSDAWHRRFDGSLDIHWCNAPDGGVGGSAGSGSSSASGSPGSGGSGAGSGAGGGDAGCSGPSTSGDGQAQAADAGAGDSAFADASAGDGATEAASGPACTSSSTCGAGTQCVGGGCVGCAGGICICAHDSDCTGTQVCDHASATCAEPPPACTQLLTEAACSTRADCVPIYGGMHCTNGAGSECHSGEANCTCTTYAFTACLARGDGG